MNIIFEKYTSKKKKDIVDYAKVLEQIITIEDNQLWSNARTFNSIVKKIINYYVDNYYFNSSNYKDPIEYSNDNINQILLSIVDYYKSINKSQMMVEKKNETFLLAIIICCATYVDIAANVIDDEYILLKNNFKKMLKHLSKTKILKIYCNDRITLNNLFNIVKKNIVAEKKFFTAFKELPCKNEYQLINEKEPYYKVRFVYKINGIDEYKPETVLKYRDMYVDKYIQICYELLIVTLLKQKIVNKNNKRYLIPINDSLLEQDDSLNIFAEPLIKNNIIISIPLSSYRRNIDNIMKYQEKGYKFIYRYDDTDLSIFDDKNNIEVICSKDFFDNNKDEYSKYLDRNIRFIENQNNKSITDDIMLKENSI